MKKETVRPANFAYKSGEITALTEIIKRNDLMLGLIDELTEKLEKYQNLSDSEEGKVENHIQELIDLLEKESVEYVLSSKKEFYNIKSIERHGEFVKEHGWDY